jgi:hypothetical protein
MQSMIAIKMAGVHAPGTMNRIKTKIATVAVTITSGAALVGSASASANLSVDFSGIGSLISQVATQVIPAMGDLVIAIVPMMMILAVVGFVMMFFDKIIGMVDKVFNK